MDSTSSPAQALQPSSVRSKQKLPTRVPRSSPFGHGPHGVRFRCHVGSDSEGISGGKPSFFLEVARDGHQPSFGDLRQPLCFASVNHDNKASSFRIPPMAHWVCLFSGGCYLSWVCFEGSEGVTLILSGAETWLVYLQYLRLFFWNLFWFNPSFCGLAFLNPSWRGCWPLLGGVL